MKLNTETWHVRANIRNNIKRFLPQLQVYAENTQRIAIVGGGWSLESTFPELRELYFNGVKIIALNGAANWLMERNLRPSMYLQLDAREVNESFVHTPIPQCKYFLASQCHPRVFELCSGRDVTIFHVLSTKGEKERDRLDYHYGKGRWQEVPSAGTIGLVAIMLMRMLGFRFQHIFGLDSCYAPDGRHHAYAQSWNDAEGAGTFWLAGREFKCSAWQASQVGEFIEFLKQHGSAVCLDIHGDGALAHVLKTGAELPVIPPINP